MLKRSEFSLDRNLLFLRYPSRIEKIDYEEGKMLVHFERWSHRYDEWIYWDSNRLRPLERPALRKEGLKDEEEFFVSSTLFPFADLARDILTFLKDSVKFSKDSLLVKKYFTLFRILKLEKKCWLVGQTVDIILPRLKQLTKKVCI